MKTLVSALALTGVMVVGQAQAAVYHGNDSCNISLNYDVTLQQQQLRVAEKNNELYRIDGDKLFVNGKQVSLNHKQQQLLQDYRTGLSAQIPKVVTLLDNAMDLATDAVGSSLTPLLGDSGTEKLNGALEKLHQRINDAAYQRGDVYYIGASDDSLDQVFGDEFENDIEQVVMSSIGNIMVNIGQSMINSDGGSFEEKMEAFGEKMERLGDDIEARMEVRSSEIERNADELCESFAELQKLEAKVQQQIPELEDYTLISKRH
ncbi:YggN family protein [Shewanella avicenniae]|uniref:YggN family protein n=1 Tax=Shewanella avicenniae TaxID=2814294 RepID=A0ABX7QNC0_9GAMM|nr:YggN family protein [Shewanella avicenniae]QSX32859.1 YggN family protein [Shewanella avicenniae]